MDSPNQSPDASTHDEIDLEIQRLELETRRLELEIKHEELRAQRNRRARWAMSPVWIPLVATFFAFAGTFTTTFVQARDRDQAESLDRLKFEKTVVSEAFKGAPPRTAALRILMAAHFGYIRLTHEQQTRLIAFVQRDVSLPAYLMEIVAEKYPDAAAPSTSGTAPAPSTSGTAPAPPVSTGSAGSTGPGPAAIPGPAPKPVAPGPK